VIARVEVGDKWKEVVGIEVARRDLRKSFSQSWGFATPEQNGLRR
jgi:hypothetical protein